MSTIQVQRDIVSLSSEPTSDVSHPLLKPIGAVSLPTKSAADFYGYGDLDSPSLGGSPYSLNRLMSSRKTSSLNAVRNAFVLDLDQLDQQVEKKKVVSFGLPSSEQQQPIDYGYGDDSAAAMERPAKRRRYERRNSKTPAMLMQMQSTLLSFDFSKLDQEVEAKELEADKLKKPRRSDLWDGGLEIAEELVMQLQNRRLSRMGHHPSSP